MPDSTIASKSFVPLMGAERITCASVALTIGSRYARRHVLPAEDIFRDRRSGNRGSVAAAGFATEDGMRARGSAGRSRHSEAGMTTFDKREEGFEKQFAVDEELKFKATARRNKMLGLWAAVKLGLSGAEADAYAKEVVVSDLEEAGDHDVFGKIRRDFDAKGVHESDHQIRRTMDELMAKAVQDIKAGR
jgi:hypothetical protein